MTTLSDKIFGTFLGLEYNEDSVVLTYMKNRLSGISIITSSVFDLGDNEEAIEEIREYTGKYGSDTDRVFVSIPDKWAIVKFTEMPSVRGKSRNAISNMMKFEIERHIPFPIEEVAYDFLVLEEKKNVCSVIFVVVKKEKMDTVNEFMEKLSLKPQSITISSFAVLNAIELGGVPAGGWQEIIGIVRQSRLINSKNQASVLIHINKHGASVALIRDGLCTHLKSFVLDTEQPLSTFLDDISKYLAEVQARHSVEHLRNLIISGDTVSLGVSADELLDRMKSRVESAEHVINFRETINGTEIRGIESAVGACFAGLGTGTYRINMLPHKMEYTVKKIAPLTMKMLIVLIAVLVIAVISTEAYNRKKQIDLINQTLQKNKPEIEAVEKLEKELNYLQEKHDFLTGIRMNEITLEILTELSNVLPRDAWVTNLNYKVETMNNKKETLGELVISGYAASSSSLIPLLEDSPFFEQVEFVGPIKKTRNKEQFKLSARIIPINQEEFSKRSE